MILLLEIGGYRVQSFVEMGLNSNGQREATSLRNGGYDFCRRYFCWRRSSSKITLMRTIGSRLILMEMVNLAWILVVMFGAIR